MPYGMSGRRSLLAWCRFGCAVERCTLRGECSQSGQRCLAVPGRGHDRGHRVVYGAGAELTVRGARGWQLLRARAG